jgi:hypothetical protein
MFTPGEERGVRVDRLRDTVEIWIEGLGTAVEMNALIEVAFLMAAADGEISVPEYEQLVTTIEHATSKRLPPGRVRSLITRLTDSLKIDGWEKRLAAIAESISSPGSRRVAYRLAAGVSFIDGWVQDDEARLFGLLAESFEIPLDEASSILTSVRDELYGSDSELTNPVILLEPSRRIQRDE